MKTLHLIRHARAEAMSMTGRDRDRSLHPLGREQLERLGRRLEAAGPWPERWLVSPAERTRQTAEILSGFAPAGPALEFVEAIYEAEPQGLVRVLTNFGANADRVALVGHNPSLEVLAAILLGEPRIDFRPGSLLVVRIDCEAWGAILTAPRLDSHLIIGDAG